MRRLFCNLALYYYFNLVGVIPKITITIVFVDILKA